MNRVYLFIIMSLMAFATTVNAAKWKAKHVVVIGIDGWGAYSVPKAHDIPVIRSLMNDGCYTLKKRCVLPSESAVNWATMFNGGCTEMHGYDNWNSRKPAFPSMVVNKHGVWPTVFSELREQYPKSEIGCIAEWDGIKYVIDSLSVNNYDIASNYEKDSEQLCRMAETYIKEKKPTLLAVCFDQLDHTGHADGHDTPAYYATLSRLDTQIGRIIIALKEAGIYDDTIIMITADHGGINKRHGGKTMLEMEIPFIACGKNIKKGMVITDNMMQFDTAATIAYVFNLKRPQAWIGRPMYSIFK